MHNLCEKCLVLVLSCYFHFICTCTHGTRLLSDWGNRFLILNLMPRVCYWKLFTYIIIGNCSSSLQPLIYIRMKALSMRNLNMESFDRCRVFPLINIHVQQDQRSTVHNEEISYDTWQSWTKDWPVYVLTIKYICTKL